MDDKKDLKYLAEHIAESHGMSIEDAETFVECFFSLIEEALRTDKTVRVRGLGRFSLNDSQLTFTPDHHLRETINRPFEHFDTVPLNDGVAFDDMEVVEEAPAESEAPAVEAEEAPAEAVETPEEPAAEAVVPAEAVAEEAPVVEEETAAEPETPAEEAPKEEPEEDPLQRMIAEAVDEKRKRETIVSDLYSGKREEAAKSAVADVKPRKQRNYMKYVLNGMIVIVFAAVFGCGFLVLKMYFPEMFAADKVDDTAEVDKMAMDFQQIVLADTTIDHEADTMVVVPDTLNAPQDTVAAAESVEEPKKEVKPVAVKEIKVAQPTSQPVAQPVTQPMAAADKTDVSTIPVHPDSVTYKIKGTKATHTLQPGETLTRVSLKYYGTKDLYPYIVKYNSDVIKNPNNVPIGTTLRIPELVKK